MQLFRWKCLPTIYMVAACCLFSGNIAHAQLTIDLKFNGQDMRILGVSENDRTGFSVAMGDINGDGRSDYVIGAPGFDYPGRADCGIVYVLLSSDTLGSVINLSTLRPDLTRIMGPAAGTQLGSALAVGHIDPDINADIACGMPNATANGKFSAGMIAVVLGTSSLPDTIDTAFPAAGLSIIEGENVFDKLGSSLAIGDINNNGFGDVVAGAPLASAPAGFAAGRVYVIYGDATLPARIDLAAPTTPIMQIFGERSNGTFGTACTAADVNGDSHADIITGAPQATVLGRSSAGAVYLILGSPAPADTVDISLSPPGVKRIYGHAAGDLTGSAVSHGQTTNDIIADVIFSAPEHSLPGRNGCGTVYVLPGATELPDTIDLKRAPDFVVDMHGPLLENGMGNALAAADLNADGLDDVIIGAPNTSPAGRTSAGKVYIFFGRSPMHTFYDFAASPPGLTTILGAVSEERTGCSLAAGDTDGDLYDDLIIGAQRGIGSGGSRTGAANVIFGDDDITPAQLVHYALTATGEGAELVWELDEPVDVSLFTIERRRESGTTTFLPSLWIEPSFPAAYRLFDGTTEQGVHYVYSVYLEQNLLFSAEIDIPSLDTRLHPNYPNPFQAETTIPFHITEAGHVLMKIYDVSGSLVTTVADARFGQGPNHIVWDGCNSSGDPAPSGIYFVRMLHKGNLFQNKIVLIR
jgi:hypothetical protein